MRKRPGTYYRPKSLSKAVALLAEPDSAALAGGTKLLAVENHLRPAVVVDLQALGLSQIKLEQEPTDSPFCTVGATTKVADLIDFLQQDEARANSSPASLLAAALHKAGPNTYRHAATLGGIVASRLPDSELLAALLVLNARLQMANAEPTSLQSYLMASERPFGLITAIKIPWLSGQSASERVARTPADDPIVSVTCWQSPQQSPHLAATGIASRPCRLISAEDQLTALLNAEVIAAAGTAAAAACTHPGDFRGDTTYRASMVALLTRRTLTAIA